MFNITSKIKCRNKYDLTKFRRNEKSGFDEIVFLPFFRHFLIVFPYAIKKLLRISKNYLFKVLTR